LVFLNFANAGVENKSSARTTGLKQIDGRGLGLLAYEFQRSTTHRSRLMEELDLLGSETDNVSAFHGDAELADARPRAHDMSVGWQMVKPTIRPKQIPSQSLMRERSLPSAILASHKAHSVCIKGIAARKLATRIRR
jgi:hypothetical protein